MQNSQLKKVLEYVQANGSITTYEAFAKLNVTRLAAKIFDLERKGYQFDREVVREDGRSWHIIYSLSEESED